MSFPGIPWRRLVTPTVCVAMWCIAGVAAGEVPPPMVLTVEGTNAWIQRFRSNLWESAYPNQILHERDRGRTGRRSQATIRLSDLSVMRINERSEFEIQPLPESKEESEFSLLKGLLYLLHRDRPGSHRFRTPTATAATRGTEFTLEVEDGTGRSILTVLEGEAELSNPLGTVRLGSGEQGVAAAGQAPVKTAVIDTVNVVQWLLYYPGVIDPAELELGAGERGLLADSVAAYRAGDLLKAVQSYPEARQPTSDNERLYLAGLSLSVGQVQEAEALLDAMEKRPGWGEATGPLYLSQALRMVIAAVQERADLSSGRPAVTASELLARSYAEQSLLHLREALESARQAAKLSPDFAFGWARVAELEFSHGNTRRAHEALNRSLTLAPRNAQAHALKGFLLAAENRTDQALRAFEEAMAIDGGLGNAWLGRGLCRIRRGRGEEGRLDLQVAAALEPQRAALRSYLGKAFGNAGDSRRAETELLLAEELDARDPTASLYLALLRQQQNRANEAVRDLERSQDMNDNRRVYRSSLLLDQDRAVRGANLAAVYRDAGMVDLSAREAGRAVNADYANYSAHLFLANSFNEVRDPKHINFRYETAWFSEYLIANLLAPVGAGTLSQAVSQQEYSKLFERDRLGFTSSTEYFSHGEWVQSVAQYGLWGNTSYAAEGYYHTDNGHRPNNDLHQLTTVLNLKQQMTPKDSVYVRAYYYENESGDVNHYYDEASASAGLRTRETYQPSVLAGLHHEWNPGSHTLFLAGRLENTYERENPVQGTLFLNRLFGPISSVAPLFYRQDYRSDLELYSGDLQHILQHGDHTFVAGARYQQGEFETENEQSNGVLFNGGNVSFPIEQRLQSDLERQSAYAYHHWQMLPQVFLVGGVSYDRVTFPENYRFAPILEAEETREQLSPKAGFIVTPTSSTTLRGGYFRSLGGASLDQSIRIEPSQIAGFNQAYRSIIPESIGGANAAPTFETWALSLEQKVGQGTFIGISGEILASEVDRTIGAVAFQPLGGPGVPFTTEGITEELDFRERTLSVTLDQLIGKEWSLGVRYRLSHAEMEDVFSDIPAAAEPAGGFERERFIEARLHQVHLAALYNHASGVFARGGAIWSAQSNHGYSPELPGDDFWQVNMEAGYRFARRRAEVRIGLLNAFDQDYRLNPLNLAAELPRGRTLAVSMLLNF